MKKTIIFVFIISLFISCQSSVDTNLENQPSDSLNGIKPKIVSLKKFSDRFFSDEAEIFLKRLEVFRIAGNGTKILMSQVDKKIILLNKEDKIIKIINKIGKGPGEFLQPSEINLLGDNIYITDLSLNKVSIYNRNGIWVNDVVIRDTRLFTALPLNENEIIIVCKPETNEGFFFRVYDLNGYLKRKVSLASKELKIAIDKVYLFRPRVFKMPNQNLLVSLSVTGDFFIFDSSGSYLYSFNIQNGEEWQNSIRFEEELEKKSKHGKSYPIRITDVAFDVNNNIFITWGGKIKNENTIIMVFSPEGKFINRILGNNNFQVIPITICFAPNGNLWMHESYSLDKKMVIIKKLKLNL